MHIIAHVNEQLLVFVLMPTPGSPGVFLPPSSRFLQDMH